MENKLKMLVAYFSASGVTKNVATKIAKNLDADLFEIKPKQLYTKEDLDWTKKDSRSTIEMKDRSSRPEIENKVDMGKYMYILVGFPIWWYREPSIIDTFLEQYDFEGKTIIPFATSGSSGIGEAPFNMQKLAPKAKVTKGKRLSLSDAEIEEFSKEVCLTILKDLEDKVKNM